MMIKWSWLSGEGEVVCFGLLVVLFRMERMVVFVCLFVVFLIWNKLFSLCFLMDCNNVVVMFMCVLRICLCVVSLGKVVMVVFKFVVLDVKLIWEMLLILFIFVDFVILVVFVLYLFRLVLIFFVMVGKGLFVFLV